MAGFPPIFRDFPGARTDSMSLVEYTCGERLLFMPQTNKQTTPGTEKRAASLS